MFTARRHCDARAAGPVERSRRVPRPARWPGRIRVGLGPAPFGRATGPGHDLGWPRRPRVDPRTRIGRTGSSIFPVDRAGTDDAPTSSTMQRSLLSRSSPSLLSSLLLFFVVPACAPDTKSSKQPLAVCEEGEDGCPSVPRAEKQPPASRSNGPTGDPSTPTNTNEEDLASAKTDDAGAPGTDAAAEPAAPPGTLCKALDKCCDQIEEAGFMPDNCRSVVALKHESACYAQHQQYKSAGDCS